MVKNIFLTILLTLCLVSLPACQKSPINGDLDGRWQIMEMDIDGHSEVVKDKQLYYNFSLHVCNLSFYGGSYTDGFFQYDNDSITINFPYIHTEQGMENLLRYGISSNPVVFEVVYLDKNKLILKEGNNNVITLRKF